MRGWRLIGVVVAIALAVTSVDLGAQEKPTKPKASQAVTTPVNLNTATAAELQALPGVGAATARLILEHRQKNGGLDEFTDTP